MAEPQTDPVAAILLKAPPPLRASTWDVFQQAANEDDLAAKLETMPLAQSVKADLWDLKHRANEPATFSSTNAKDAAGNAEVDPNTVGTFMSHLGSQINPVPAGQLLPLPKSIGGAGWDAPFQAGKHLLEAQGQLFDRAKAAYAKGDYVGAGIHALHWLLPVIGPALDQAGNEMRAGKYAAGLGDTVGLATSLVAPEAVGAARASFNRTTPAAAMAESAAGAADARFADVMSPKGTSKAIQRTAKQAEGVAERVRQGTSAITPGGLQTQIGDRLTSAGEALDAAYGQMPKVAYSPGAVLSRLQQAYDNLKVKGTGGSVIPAASAPRAQAIQDAINEVKKLGPYTNTENLAKLRNAWKGLAQDAFVPQLNPNFQQIRGAAKGWADAWSSLQDTLTDRHPELHPLNADFHVWKQAADAMEALQDQQRAKPTVGRTIMARAGGAAAGAALGGPTGMVAGEIVAPLVERGLTNGIAPTTKMLIARQLGNLADAIRNNQTTRVEIILKALRPVITANIAQQANPSAVPALAQTGSQR